MSDPDFPRLLDLIDRNVASERARRSDAVGLFAGKVLGADDADAEFENWARAYIEARGQDSRRSCIAKLRIAFGIKDRPQFKKWLRGKGLVAAND